MKTFHPTRLLAPAILFALLASCQKETPQISDAPEPAEVYEWSCWGEFPYIYPILLPVPPDFGLEHADPICNCAPGISGGLISASGSTVVDFQTATPTPWGEYAISYGAMDLGQGYGAGFSIPSGWVVEDLYHYEGACANITYSGGLPVPDAAWQYIDFIPNVAGSGNWGGLLPVGCGCVAMKANIAKVSFLNTPIPSSRRSIYFNHPLSNTDDNVQEVCFNGCPPVVTNVTVGTCVGCDSQNIVDFYDCDSLTLSSCKYIARVKVIYTDCSFQQYNGVGLSMNHAAPAGKEISHIFVKSGCNGPGLGRRIDSPCVEPTCN